MNARADELIRLLDLAPHPEGGHFVEVFRSQRMVAPGDERGLRTALTLIYFLLVEGSCSRWHRVLSDETWHWHEGSPLELLTVSPTGEDFCVVTLGPVAADSRPVHVVPAGWWQAARPRGSYGLVSCCVAPGFDYADFALLSSIPEDDRPAGIPKALLDALL